MVKQLSDKKWLAEKKSRFLSCSIKTKVVFLEEENYQILVDSYEE